MSNWYLNSFAFPDKDQIQYIITAFHSDSSKTMVTELEVVKKQVKDLSFLLEAESEESRKKQERIE